MKIGIMQPYFMPYIGYWQLINTVDKFVIYDNIEFTKQSWIRRNRILINGKDRLFTLPLKKDSDYLNINDRYLSIDYYKDKKKILNLISLAYKKSPFYDTIYPLIEKCFNYDNDNLFEFIYNSIKLILNYLEINTEIVVSSSIKMDHNLKCKYRVIETCKALGGRHYINPKGGLELYDKEEFAQHNIKLQFLKTNKIEYKQYDNEFIPNLSIIDVMMFNSKEEISKLLNQYSLI